MMFTRGNSQKCQNIARQERDATFYDALNVKAYTHWILRVHEYQTYLGQVVIWLKRETAMQRLSTLTEAERTELWNVVFFECERALEDLWNPDHLNYAWLGNLIDTHGGHGHFHVIPRYRNPRDFKNRIFVDNLWGDHYAREADVSVPLDIAYAVRDAYKEKLGEKV
jgi:diadenosine tetraphosphate (Ap4A) HIT family hydrolase